MCCNHGTQQQGYIQESNRKRFSQPISNLPGSLLGQRCLAYTQLSPPPKVFTFRNITQPILGQHNLHHSKPHPTGLLMEQSRPPHRGIREKIAIKRQNFG
mmetsp:Transcript_24083/g.30638  ORF Transcript_24083/g.30638 Transcript_24083/m.30638 type:complete len:100 (-) Transcript_24083:49-348(-)